MIFLLFQTLLRVWDCFLLEGPKVLFRICLAILKMHEKEILLKTDTISVMRHLKTCAKLTFDIDGLIKVRTCFVLKVGRENMKWGVFTCGGG